MIKDLDLHKDFANALAMNMVDPVKGGIYQMMNNTIILSRLIFLTWIIRESIKNLSL